MGMKTYIMNQEDVDSGQFPIASLKAYSKYQGVKIIIKNNRLIQTVIENGDIIKSRNGNGKLTACV